MALHTAHRPAWYVVSLRPRGEHEALHRAAQARGAGVIELSPWRLQNLDDTAARADLHAALACDAVIVTSIAAVRAAQALQPLHAIDTRWIAVGAGTAQALGAAGIERVDVPARMDSEGVLALPVLNARDVRRVGLLTAPGGRDALAPALIARGIDVVRADVYRRVDVALDAGAIDAIRTLDAPAALAVSSAGALQRVVSQVDDAIRARLCAMQVLAASARIAALARALGFDDIAIAASARPQALLAVARAH